MATFSHSVSVLFGCCRQPWTSYRRDTKTHFDQSNRDIETMKFCPNSRTLRANVEVSSLENVRSPAVKRLFEPGVAPLSRAYPRLMNAVPSGLSRRFATKLNAHSFSTLASERRSKRWQEPFWKEQKVAGTVLNVAGTVFGLLATFSHFVNEFWQ